MPMTRYSTKIQNRSHDMTLTCHNRGNHGIPCHMKCDSEHWFTKVFPTSFLTASIGLENLQQSKCGRNFDEKYNVWESKRVRISSTFCVLRPCSYLRPLYFDLFTLNSLLRLASVLRPSGLLIG